MFSRWCRDEDREEHTYDHTTRQSPHSRMTCDLVSHVGQSTFVVDDGGKKERGNTKQVDLPATREVAQIDPTDSLVKFV